MAIQAYTTEVVSRHWLRMPATDSQELFIFTGVGVFGTQDIKGVSEDSWERGRATISADYSNLIQGEKAIDPSYYTVAVHLAAIYNRNEANDTGWAVDSFSINKQYNDLTNEDNVVAFGNLSVGADVAVRDTDAYIYRLAYNVTILGRVVDFRPPPIE